MSFDDSSTFVVEGSNSAYVAAYGNNTDTSYVQLYTNSEINSGYVYGISNEAFVLGESNMTPDIVVANHNVGFGGTTTPQYTIDVTGSMNFTNGVYKNGTYLPVDAWQVGPTATGLQTGCNVGISTTVPAASRSAPRPLYVSQGIHSIPPIWGEAAVFNGPVAILNGINDSYRFISALDNSMTPGTSRFITFGGAASPNNQAELSYNHVGVGNQANYLGMGLYGGMYLSVTGAGNVGVGTTSPASKLSVFGGACVGQGFAGVTAPADTLLVSSNIGIGTSAPQASFQTTGEALVGSLRAYGEIVSFSDMSDASLKQDYVPLTDCISKLDKLQPVEFTWRPDIFNTERAGTRDVGLVAQAVEGVLPHVVGSMKVDATTYKTIRYEKIVPYLLQAIKELTSRVCTLENTLAEVLSKNI